MIWELGFIQILKRVILTSYHLVAIWLILAPGLSYASENPFTPTGKALVQRFIDAFAKNDLEAISDLVSYPLHRKFPLPAIKDKEDFHRRFSQVFDKAAVAAIAKSSPEADWEPMPMGFMLSQGTLWLDTDGFLMTVNAVGDGEEKVRRDLIEKERANLYPSLRQFEEPTVYGETAKFKIRVDQLSETEFRYAVWPIGKEQSEKPDLVIRKGTVEYEGSGGNHHFEFKNGAFTYWVDFWIIAEDGSPPGKLFVFKHEDHDNPALVQDFIKLEE